jgi:serine-type D-Ala-D-Ala carboxypeptidase/endopeptidase (penicillin-binding protein 4)
MTRPPTRKVRVIRRLSLRALVVVVAMLGSLVLVPSAVAGTTTVTMSASKATVTYGDPVTISGAASGDAQCDAGRTVRLRWRGAGTTAFAVVDEGTTTADGSFSFEATEPTTGRYGVTFVATGSCTAVTSTDVIVRVRALVDASVVTGSSEAGSCVDVTAIVSPPKPGQTAQLQKRVDGAWRTIATMALNGDGDGRASPCLGWDDIGVVHYRVRWPSQDTANLAATSVSLAFEVVEGRWMRRIDDLVGHRPISISVGEAGGTYVYRHLDGVTRTPASNEKLLLSMALLDAFGPDHRISTEAAADTVDGAVIRGDLWLLGHGDPIVTRSTLAPLAQQVAAAGITRITGHVMGSTSYFARDWDAPGWNSVATDYVNRPTALTFEGNHDPDPEREAAAAFTKLLEKRDITVRGKPGAGRPPSGLDTVGTVDSRPLAAMLAKMLRPSWNFAAEVLGKGLGVETRGTPGTIAKGAASIEAWVRSQGVDFTLNDNSGLSYANRVDAAGMVRLLWAAEGEDWLDTLRQALPTGGQGTLEDRLKAVKIRAKTGTLTGISALSGWLWADPLDAWIEFSILSDVPKPAATGYEDKIVRLLANNVG